MLHHRLLAINTFCGLYPARAFLASLSRLEMPQSGGVGLFADEGVGSDIKHREGNWKLH